jgi:hypothetical protein
MEENIREIDEDDSFFLLFFSEMMIHASHIIDDSVLIYIFL